jgi:F0F1-type ATP synthase membrane subunit b/b'
MLCPALACAAEGAEAQGSWTALIFYVINFGLFMWIVKRFGGPQISAFFKDRAKNIRANMGRASQALHDAQELSKRAAQLTAGLADEKKKMSADLATETAFQMTQIDKQARESVDRIKRDGALGVNALREAGQRRLRESLAASAVQVARELVRHDFQPGDQARLLQNFSSRLDEEVRRS